MIESPGADDGEHGAVHPGTYRAADGGGAALAAAAAQPAGHLGRAVLQGNERFTPHRIFPPYLQLTLTNGQRHPCGELETKRRLRNAGRVEWCISSGGSGWHRGVHGCAVGAGSATGGCGRGGVPRIRLFGGGGAVCAAHDPPRVRRGHRLLCAGSCVWIDCLDRGLGDVTGGRGKGRERDGKRLVDAPVGVRSGPVAVLV